MSAWCGPISWPVSSSVWGGVQPGTTNNDLSHFWGVRSPPHSALWRTEPHRRVECGLKRDIYYSSKLLPQLKRGAEPAATVEDIEEHVGKADHWVTWHVKYEHATVWWIEDEQAPRVQRRLQVVHLAV